MLMLHLASVEMMRFLFFFGFAMVMVEVSRRGY